LFSFEFFFRFRNCSNSIFCSIWNFFNFDFYLKLIFVQTQNLSKLEICSYSEFVQIRIYSLINFFKLTNCFLIRIF
jgi:hypothetical protein